MRWAGIFVCAAALLAGCHDPVTEVVVVLTSDFHVPNEQVAIGAAPGTDLAFPFNNSTVETFPVSVGIQSLGQTPLFSVRMELSGTDPVMFQSQPLVIRNVFGVRFVPGEIRMLVVPMLQVCACKGTACPLPGTNPDCDDISNPETVPFDPSVAPPSGSSSGPVFQASVDEPPAR